MGMTISNRTASSSKIAWHGGLFASTSLAHVNRELCLQLLDQGLDVSFHTTEPDDFSPDIDPRFGRLNAIRSLPNDRADITIRHHWPPDFTPVSSGRLVLILPWEFGSIPKTWVENISAFVDEVWVPSSYVRECYINSGVKTEKVVVVPNGVDTVAFTPAVQPLPLATRKSFRFLFVGGSIHRKGIDILLGAYRQAFRGSDDVCLVIKDMGGATFYQGQTAGDMIKRFQELHDAPEIEYIDRDLSPAELAGLYTACTCLVHPYRGEGFGLPIAEAMACGVPPIVTGYGAAMDFCTSDNSWLIPARIEKLSLKQVGNLETVDYPWLAEPDFQSLVDVMRHVFANPDEIRVKGNAACRHINAHFTWEHAGKTASERLRALAGLAPVVCDTTPAPISKSELTFQVASDPTFDVCAKARTLYQQGKIDEAIDLLLNKGIGVTPDAPTPCIELAEILVSAGRYEEALQVMPEMPPATAPQLKAELEALCLCALGDDKHAELAANRAGNRPRVLVVRGTLAARLGNLAVAESYFRQAVEQDPGCGSGWLSLGMLLWAQGKRHEALQAVKHSVTVDSLNTKTAGILQDMVDRLHGD